MFTQFVLPAIITAAAVLVGGIINAGAQSQINEENIEAQKKANETNIELANTSIQRKVKDAVSAGLSPLAAINGPSTSSVVTQPTHNPGIDLSSMMSQLANIGSSVQSNLASKYQSDINLQGTKFSANKLANSARYKTDSDFEVAMTRAQNELLMHDAEMAKLNYQIRKNYEIQKKEIDVKNKQLLINQIQLQQKMLSDKFDWIYKTEENRIEHLRLQHANSQLLHEVYKHRDEMNQRQYETFLKTCTEIFGDTTRLFGQLGSVSIIKH